MGDYEEMPPEYYTKKESFFVYFRKQLNQQNQELNTVQKWILIGILIGFFIADFNWLYF